MDLNTNIQRVEHMLYNICGCNNEEAKIVLKECLKKNKEMEKR